MTKATKAAISGKDKKAMDAVLQRMLSTPPQPTAKPAVAAKATKKRVTGKKQAKLLK